MNFGSKVLCIASRQQWFGLSALGLRISDLVQRWFRAQGLEVRAQLRVRV